MKTQETKVPEYIVKRYPLLFSLLVLLIIIVFLFVPLSQPLAVLMNFIFCLPLFGLFLVVFRRYKAASVVSSAALLFVYYVNKYVQASRLIQIQFSDFYCIADALRVADQYPLIFNWEIALYLLAVVCIITVFICLFRKMFPDADTKNKTEKLKQGLILVFAPILMIVIGSVADIIPVLPIEFDMNSFISNNGIFYAWYIQYRQSVISEPEGYSAESIRALTETYPGEDGSASADAVPDNLIIIMNEAFTDYCLIGETHFSQDPLPTIHSMKDELTIGKLAVSVFAGTTCNSEYEFLTGNSSAFLPQGSIPYLQYVYSESDSICYDLADVYGRLTALHPYYSQEWRRNYVYPFLGFDDFISGENWSDSFTADVNANITDTTLKKANFGEDLEYVRGFVSDAECYRKITEVIEEDRLNDRSSFVFAITIQNHGGYIPDPEDDFEEFPYVENHDEVNEYLTCSSISDTAFADLINSLREYPEKTAVIMFGDHQPGLDMAGLYTSYARRNVDLQMYADQYTVPYIFWANYDVDWEAPETLSINYLSALIKKNLGLPLSSWDQLRLEALEQYPVITANFAMDSDNTCMQTEEILGSDIMNSYAQMQYARMFE